MAIENARQIWPCRKDWTEHFRRRTYRRGKHKIEVEPYLYLRDEAAANAQVVLIWFLDKADVQTGKIGRWFNGQLVHHYTVEEIAKEVGLSSDQTERSLKKLEDNGLIFTVQRRKRTKNDDGEETWAGFTAERKITPKGFEALSVGVARDRYLKKLRKEKDEAKRQAKIVATEQKRLAPPDPWQDDWQVKGWQSKEAYDGFVRLSLTIGKEHPDWSVEEVEAAARADLARPPPQR